MSDIVIYGRGKTGQGLHTMLKKMGKDAVFYDDCIGFDGDADFTDKSLVLLSPGVKPNAVGMISAKKAGAHIVTELEFCFKHCLGKCVSVTGTNGKTTICEMVSHILRKASVKCRLLGNGGIPLSSEVLDVNSDEIVVLESSSFQLNNVKEFSPYISLFSNIAYDHINYHDSFDNYVSAKINNFIHQTEGYAIFNFDDENVVELSNLCQCKKLYYSVSDSKANCYWDGSNVVVNIGGKKSIEHCCFLGDYSVHNLSNALGAILITSLLGVSLDKSILYISDYRLLPHRMETVAILNGVTFVDDSKATNVHATVSALKNYKQPLALILGGSDKGECFEEIFANLADNVKYVAASGSTAEKIADCGKAYGIEVAVFDDLKQATEQSYNAVCRYDNGVVLMSNACASFDRFSGYAERGDYFCQAVKGLCGD